MTPLVHDRRRSGFTLVEMLISMIVLSVVLGATTVSMMKVQQRYTLQRGSVEARDMTRSLEVMLGAMFRTSGANPRRITTGGVLMTPMTVDPLARGVWNNIDLRADFNPVDSLLTGELEQVHVRLTNDTVYLQLRSGGALDPVVAPVSQLLFRFYDVDGNEITNAANVPARARRVRMTIRVPIRGSSRTVERDSWIAIRN
jgi:prepilin-type N-terminal cleavage/methylation domain-containing protein